MDHFLHRPPSVGSLVKKIMNINPDLGVPEIIAVIREATQKRPDGAGEFGSSEIVNEELALELARRMKRQN